MPCQQSSIPLAIVTTYICTGFSIAIRGDASVLFGSTSRPVFLDKLNCRGTESHLLDCPLAQPVGLAECDHTQVAGVHCKGA